jgi:protein-L-isoaspartate O-methyltransferase
LIQLFRLGSLGKALSPRQRSVWVIELLEVKPNERVLEAGFGPGVAIKRLSEVADHVGGIDQSREMVAQAQGRYASAIKSGCVELATALSTV